MTYLKILSTAETITTSNDNIITVNNKLHSMCKKVTIT